MHTPEMPTKTKGKYHIIIAGKSMSMLHAADQLKQQLHHIKDQGHKHICVDLTGAPIIDSSVIGALAFFSNEIREQQGELVILTTRNIILETLLRTHMHELMRIINNETDL